MTQAEFDHWMSLFLAALPALLAMAGISALGVVIGMMIGIYFKRHQGELTLTAIAGAISMLSGGGVIAIFHFLDPSSSVPREYYWLYPCGLAVGFIYSLRSFHID